jgi:MFS family permease
VYGWPALRRDLIREGGLTERELGAVFTCGAWSVQGGRFLVGLARDALGTRVAACACLVLVVLGSALVALADAGDFPAMCFGMLFLGMGSGAQLCVQPVTMLFQRVQSTMMASLSGAFQLSGLVFLLCSLLAGAGAGRAGAYLAHAAVVAGLLLLSLAYLPRGNDFHETTPTTPTSHRPPPPPSSSTPDFFPEKEQNRFSRGREPGGDGSREGGREGARAGGRGDASRDSRESPGDLGAAAASEPAAPEGSDAAAAAFTDNAASSDEVVLGTQKNDSSSASASAPPPPLREETSSVSNGAARTANEGTPPHFGASRGEQFASAEYVGLVTWFSLVVVPSQYYVLSIGYQMERKGDAEGAYARWFTLLSGASAALAPLGGMVADRAGVGFAQGVGTALVAAGFLALLGESDDPEGGSVNAPLAVCGIAAYSVGRLFVFAMYFSAIGRRFGFEHYGGLAGFGMLTSAAASMLQYPLFDAALRGEAAARAVNAGCAACALAGAPYAAWLGARERRERRARRREEGGVAGSGSGGGGAADAEA